MGFRLSARTVEFGGIQAVVAATSDTAPLHFEYIGIRYKHQATDRRHRRAAHQRDQSAGPSCTAIQRNKNNQPKNPRRSLTNAPAPMLSGATRASTANKKLKTSKKSV